MFPSVTHVTFQYQSVSGGGGGGGGVGLLTSQMPNLLLYSLKTTSFMSPSDMQC